MKKTDQINQWLVTSGRLLDNDEVIVQSYADALLAAGVPIARMNIAQRFANPLLAAIAIIWTSEGTKSIPISKAMLSTNAYIGSPFEYVQKNRTLLRKNLGNLDQGKDHITYIEQASAGATEYLALVLEFSDGSAHSCSFTTKQPGGFTDEQANIIWETRHALANSLEPATMRRSTKSLLQTYLGDGPAAEVVSGTIERGAHTAREAVVMITDLRQFTWMSENWTEANLLNALDQYFEVVVSSVRQHGGDVLKFMGDGVLSVFVIDEQNSRKVQNANAIKAARLAIEALNKTNEQRRQSELAELNMGIGIDVGSVTYGNIGSPDRLDFTVLGRAVNMASRVQDLCKVLQEKILLTDAVVEDQDVKLRSCGKHAIRGVSDQVEIFAVD